MSWWQPFSRKHRDRELEEELQAHLAMSIHDRIERGEAPPEAERAARREFGNRALIQEVTRSMWGWNSLETLAQDLKYAVRRLRRTPGFTTVAVLSLALGIGGNTAIFSLVNTLLLRMLPVRDPGQLVELLHRYPGEPRLNGNAWSTYELMRDHNHVFSGLMAFANQAFHIRRDSVEPQTVEGGYVEGSFFQVLGLKPAMGRLIGPEDDRSDRAPSAVAVVSWAYWKSRFNLDPEIVGKQLMVEDVPVTIIGVTPRRYSGLLLESNQDVWLPLAMQPVVQHSGSARGGVWLMARLKPGVSLEQARAEMAVLYESTLDEQARVTNNPFLRKMKFEMAPAGAGHSMLREQFAKPLLMLMAVVGLLLLIACTNVASMLLARGAAREPEMALRVSLGASRFRLVRQVLTESLLLSAAGSVIGIFLAWFGTAVLLRIITSRRVGSPIALEVYIDTGVLLFTAAIALLTGLLFGLAPALRAFQSGASPSLRVTAMAGQTRVRRLLGKGLVATQVALSVVLLSAAGLFGRHLADLEHIDLGFQRDHVLLVSLDAARSGYDNERLSRAFQELLARFEAIPGVGAATICAVSPIQSSGANRGVTVEGYQPSPGEIRNVAENWVAPKYFQTLGTPLLAGRDFNLQDGGQGHARVAIINETMARYYFGNGNPLGRHVTLDGDHQPYEIVGVAGDAKYYEMREDTLRTIYFDTFQQRRTESQFVLRTSIDPAAVAADVRRAVNDSLKTISIGRITTLTDQVDASIVPERLIATLSGWFGALGTLLAAIGLYGLLAYTVARRIQEIAIRMALGATRSKVMRMVLEDALGMVCAGLAIGAPLAYWARSFAASLIEGLPVRSFAPIAFGVVAMIIVALLAAYLPARRATQVDPLEALRYE